MSRLNPMATILSLTDYKTTAGITSSEYDAQLTELIEMANDFIERYCNRVFGIGEFTEEDEGIIDHTGRYLFTTKQYPIVSVSSLSIRFYGTTSDITIDTSLLDIFERDGIIYYSRPIVQGSGIVIREEYKNQFYYSITYSGGENTVPPAVKMAAVQIVTDSKRYLQDVVTVSGSSHQANLKSIKIDDYEETYATSDDVFLKMHDKTTGLVLTQTVKDLLEPFKRRGQNLR